MWTLKAHTEEKRKSVATHVKQLRLGESSLSRDTLDMIAVLKANNIESCPLCALCDVTDEKWRLTIEGILKGNREALIVDKNNAHEAARLYRQHFS